MQYLILRFYKHININNVGVKQLNPQHTRDETTSVTCQLPLSTLQFLMQYVTVYVQTEIKVHLSSVLIIFNPMLR